MSHPESLGDCEVEWEPTGPMSQRCPQTGIRMAGMTNVATATAGQAVPVAARLLAA